MFCRLMSCDADITHRIGGKSLVMWCQALISQSSGTAEKSIGLGHQHNLHLIFLLDTTFRRILFIIGPNHSVIHESMQFCSNALKPGCGWDKNKKKKSQRTREAKFLYELWKDVFIDLRLLYVVFTSAAFSKQYHIRSLTVVVHDFMFVFGIKTWD